MRVWLRGPACAKSNPGSKISVSDGPAKRKAILVTLELGLFPGGSFFMKNKKPYWYVASSPLHQVSDYCKIL